MPRDRTELNGLADDHAGLTTILRRFWHLAAERVAHLPEGQRQSIDDEKSPTFPDHHVTDR
jgi:hypothetical protein